MNARALSGTLLTAEVVERLLPERLAARLGEDSCARAWRRLRRWWGEVAARLGPASGARVVADVATAPLVGLLGFHAGPATVDGMRRRAYLKAGSRAGRALAVVATPWGDDLGQAWRDSVRAGLGSPARWALCHNGPRLRAVDTARPFARRHVEFDLATCAADPEAFAACWALCRAEALLPILGNRRSASGGVPGPALLDTAVELAERHGLAVCGSLQVGVRTALARLGRAFAAARTRGPGRPPGDEVDQALTVIYRVLFLLYAESRGLVPLWHPIYRDSYSIEALRDGLDRQEVQTGLWETLQAISRLAHGGCHIDTLRIVAFNGRLFSPRHTPAGEIARVPDGVVRDVLLDLTTRRQGRNGRLRITYRDLGVEQLGAVYERLLDQVSPTVSTSTACPDAGRAGRRATEGAFSPRGAGESTRKATGTYYTPRSLTDFLVRRTLAPLVQGLEPERVLALRVVDPAMGSGAFLVAACRYLAAAYEAALVAAGSCRAGDLSPADRTHFRRLIAERCLFGVDLNPMAVQLARLSLWLATLAADRPLTFLDHHLRVGDSLVGASLEHLLRRPRAAHSSRRPAARRSLPLFADLDWREALRSVVPTRWRLALEPDESPETVRAKERWLDELERPGTPLAKWRSAADLWCAAWFWEDGAPPAEGVYGDLLASVLGERAQLPAAERERWMASSRDVAARRRFFHWTLEFPEVFVDATGAPREDGGFDAVLGNPPWDMVRGDNGPAAARRPARDEAARMARFAALAGLYSSGTDAHVNRYQLFVERALDLVRPAGRLGLVVPWGLMADHGASALRCRLLERCDTDTLVSIDNRRGVFPIHRSMKLLLLTSSRGGTTRAARGLLGADDPAVLETLPDTGGQAEAFPVCLTTALLRRVSGPRLAVPHVRCTADLALLDRLFTSFPALSDQESWSATFGRELNATDDRDCFTTQAEDLPVVEGKHLSPFRVDLDAVRLRASRERVAHRVDAARTFERQRLAYRDVASATNRQTLIAAILPRQAISVHTVFCLRTALDVATQRFLCGVLNSFVANWIARLWVQTHVTVALVERLPVPRVDTASQAFRDIVGCVRRMETAGPTRGGPGETRRVAALAQLQALVARLYGLSEIEFRRVVETFPLVEEAQRRAAIDALGVLNVDTPV